MNITTFGSSPAAIYLAHLLTTYSNPSLQRKVSRALTANRRILKELTDAHYAGHLSLDVLGSLLDMASKRHQTEVLAPLAAVDEHIAHLVVNVLEGEVKTLKRRLQHLSSARRDAARAAQPGEAPVEPILTSIPNEDAVLPTLKARSKAYLARKGKLDTLY